MNNDMIVTMTDENGNNVKYELLDVINYNNNTYTVFYPTEPNDTEVVIFRIEELEDSDNDEYIVETDEHIIKEVYKRFKERYKGKILFADKNVYD